MKTLAQSGFWSALMTGDAVSGLSQQGKVLQ